jgi:hypothetical protein
MSTQLQPTSPRHLTRNIVLISITIAILAAIFFGGTALWKSRFGPSHASAADCRTAQQVIDKAQTIPADKKARDASYKAYRAQWNQIEDGYLQRRVSNYVAGAYELAEGRPLEQTATEFKENLDAANSHCDRTIVMPAHKPVTSR